MQINVFCNGKLDESTLGFRPRGVKDGKTIAVPVAAFKELPEKNDGLCLELTGTVKVSEKYVRVENAKVVGEIHKNAYKPSAKTMDAEELLGSLGSSIEPPFEV